MSCLSTQRDILINFFLLSLGQTIPYMLLDVIMRKEESKLFDKCTLEFILSIKLFIYSNLHSVEYQVDMWT